MAQTFDLGVQQAAKDAVVTGIYENVDAAIYHRDWQGEYDAPPSLSASLAHVLLSRSPAHARHAHPRLNPKWQSEDDQKYTVGTVAHQVLLEGNANIVMVEADDWRTKAARETREEAWRAKMTAILASDWERVLEMCASVTSQLAELDVDPIPFTVGKPEVTLRWKEPNGVACRARVDWLHEGNVAIADLKTTTRSSRGEKWSRGPLYDHGGDLQCSFYRRGVERLTGVVPDWSWVVVETEAPYVVQIVKPSSSVLALGDAKVDEAIELWGKCLATDEWPGYSPAVYYAELPPWKEAEWLAREEIAA